MRQSGYIQVFGLCACALFLWLLGPTILIAQSQSNQIPFEVNGSEHAIVNTADPALPNAEEIYVDVPSVFYGSRYQRGELNGWRYSLFPDGSAEIRQNSDPRRMPIELDCTSGEDCLIINPDEAPLKIFAIGGPKPKMPATASGEALARYLAEWILAGKGMPPKPPIASEPVLKDEGVEIAMLAGQDVPKPMKQAAVPLDRSRSFQPAQDEVDDFVIRIDQPSDQGEIVARRQPVRRDELPKPDCAKNGRLLPSTCAQPKKEISVPKQVFSGNSIDLPTPQPQLEHTQDDDEYEAPETLIERFKLKCSATGSVTLNSDTSGGLLNKPRGSLGCSAKLTDKLSVRSSLLLYANSSDQKSSDPDFTYAFTYRISDRLSLSYSNYSARFGGSDNSFLNSLVSGDLRGNYRFPKFKLPNQKPVACSASIGLPNPSDASLKMSCGYSVTSKFRIGATANLYFPNQQGTYDPDFSYTASYRPHKDWLISYGNYGNNRFPWNPSESRSLGIKGGSVSVTYALKF